MPRSASTGRYIRRRRSARPLGSYFAGIEREGDETAGVASGATIVLGGGEPEEPKAKAKSRADE
jgi:hypothetical protein